MTTFPTSVFPYVIMGRWSLRVCPGLALLGTTPCHNNLRQTREEVLPSVFHGGKGLEEYYPKVYVTVSPPQPGQDAPGIADTSVLGLRAQSPLFAPPPPARPLTLAVTSLTSLLFHATAGPGEHACARGVPAKTPPLPFSPSQSRTHEDEPTPLCTPVRSVPEV